MANLITRAGKGSTLTFVEMDGNLSALNSDIGGLRTTVGGFTTPEEFGAAGNGTTDDSTAFTNALASGRTVVLSRKKYLVGDVVAVDGCRMLGFGGQRYATDTVAAVGTTPMLVRKAGSASVIDIDGKRWCNFSGFVIHGQDRNGRGFSGGGQFNTFQDVTVLQCSAAHGGWGTVSNTYSSVHYYRNCVVADCNSGYQSLIDSYVEGGAVAACGTGIDFQPGADSNNFVGLRVEWCTGRGYSFYQSVNNQITGGLVDRCYVAGAWVEDVRGPCTFSNVHFRRNGRSNTGAADADAHIVLKNNTDAMASVQIVNGTTQTGADDGGGGNVTPRYAIVFSGANAAVTIIGFDGRGRTTAYSTGTAPTGLISLGNRGA